MMMPRRFQPEVIDYMQPLISMINPAGGGASAGVCGRYPSAIKLRLTGNVNSTLVYGFLIFKPQINSKSWPMHAFPASPLLQKAFL